LPADGDTAVIETRLRSAQIFLIAAQGELPHVRQHLAAGGRALVVQGDAVALAQVTEAPLVLGKRPQGITEQELSGLLAALAAGLVLGLNAETLSTYLGALP